METFWSDGLHLMPLEVQMYLKQAKGYKLIKFFFGSLNLKCSWLSIRIGGHIKKQQSLVVTHCGMFAINFRYISIFHLLCFWFFGEIFIQSNAKLFDNTRWKLESLGIVDLFSNHSLFKTSHTIGHILYVWHS